MPRLPVIPFIIACLISGVSFAQTEGAPLSFKGVPCAPDCSGESAGYEWAVEHRPARVDDCDSGSPVFQEGCAIWIGEQATDTEPAAYFEFDDSLDNLVE